jgi:very-short-patch-repair endonuclease
MRGANVTKNPAARRLRRDSTQAEQKLWRYLRARSLAGFKFVRQKPIGPYIVDFACREKRVVIEVDGGQHAENSHDAARVARKKGRELISRRSRSSPLRDDQWLSEHRYSVLRFWNNEVRRTSKGFGTRSSPQRLRQRPLTPTLSPHAGRGSSPADPPSDTSHRDANLRPPGYKSQQQEPVRI